MTSFEKSFNEIYETLPHQIQLGFLKLLKGSVIRSDMRKFGYKYREDAPYEVLENNVLTFEEILYLKDIEEVLERFYNSGKFVNAMHYCTEEIGTKPFTFYGDVAKYFREMGYFSRGISVRELYEIFYGYAVEKLKINSRLMKDILTFDYLSSDHSGNLPEILRVDLDKGFRDACHLYLRKELQEGQNHGLLTKTFATTTFNKDGKLQSFTPKEMIKKIYFHPFEFDILNKNWSEENKNIVMFNYFERDSVTSLYSTYEAKDFYNTTSFIE